MTTGEISMQKLQVIAILFQSALRRAAPKGEQKFSKSIKVTVDETGTFEIFADKIWKFIEFGTNPHVIKPKTKKALAFEVDTGETIITKLVHHPGTRPNPFMRSTIFNKLPKIVKSVL